MKRLLPLVLLLGLGGCQDYISILGGCPLPPKLDYVAGGPKDLPEVDTDPLTFEVAEVKERAAHKSLAGDFNALHDYVKEKCK